MSINGEPVVRDNRAKDRFEIEIDGHTAIAQYVLAPDHIIFTHTEVPPPLEGHGIAGALIKAVLDHAQAHGLKVRPLCSYARAYMQRHPETAALLA